MDENVWKEDKLNGQCFESVFPPSIFVFIGKVKELSLKLELELYVLGGGFIVLMVLFILKN